MATSLRQVQEAMNGDKPAVIEQPEVLNYVPSEPTTQVPEVKFVIFRLVKKNQRALNIDGICHNVINPKTERPETIRLIRGASSIWSSDLSELLKDKDYISKNRDSLRFVDGICRIGTHEVTKLEYARFHTANVGKNRNGAGKFDFYEYDTAMEAQYRMEKQTNKINTILAVKDMPDEAMKKLALFLDIKPWDELGMPRNEDAMRTELLLKADSQPDIVKKYMNSKEVDISYLVRKAIIDAKIDLGSQNGNAIWAGGGGFIGKIPTGRKPLEYLTELAMTNSQEGKNFLQQLQTM